MAKVDEVRKRINKPKKNKGSLVQVYFLCLRRVQALLVEF